MKGKLKVIKIFKCGYIIIDECAGIGSYLHIELNIIKNKNIEMQVMKYSNEISFGVNLRWTWHQDHACLWLDLNLLILEINLRLSDRLRWNDENNCWEKFMNKTKNKT